MEDGAQTIEDRGLEGRAPLNRYRLTRRVNVIGSAPMKKIFAILFGAVLVGAGCVNTVNERTSPGLPFVKDRVEGRYERTVDQVFNASKQVVSAMGVLVREGILYNQTNEVKTVEGKVNQRNVWIRVEGIEPKVTSVVVQTRTPGGGADIDLAHELEKQIALKLVQ